MDYYTAKFARQAKAKPTHWVIIPSGRGYRLQHLPPLTK